MGPLIFLVITLALLGGFLALTAWEGGRGARLFATGRARLDGEVDRAAFVLTHVDFSAYIREEVRVLSIRTGHYIAHLTLQAVRAAERLLTRAVRHLRARVASDAGPARETSRPFVQALGDFKEELKASRPEIPEF